MKVTRTQKGNFQISGIQAHEFDALLSGLPVVKERYESIGLATTAIDSLIEAMKNPVQEATKVSKKEGK